MIAVTDITNNENFRLTKALYKKGHSCTLHSHKDTAISIVLSGIVHEKVDDKLEIGKSAVTIIKPAQIAHQNIFTEDCTILCLYLKDIQQRKLKYNELLEEWTWISGLNCIPFLTKLVQSNCEKQIHNNISELLRYISICKKDNTVTNIPDWLADAKLFIDNNYSESINVTELAKKYNVHRVYLAKVFQKYFGQNIKSYLKALRLHSSAASLINNSSINDAAMMNGFSDQSHLQRSFRQEFLHTPLEIKNIFK